MWWPASQDEEQCSLNSCCDSIWYGTRAVYRGSCALAIRSHNSLFMFNPLGSRQAKQRGEETGRVRLYEHPGSQLIPVRSRWGVSSVILEAPVWLQPLIFPLFSLCLSKRIQSAAGNCTTPTPHIYTSRTQASSTDSWVSCTISSFLDHGAGCYRQVFGATTAIRDLLFLNQSLTIVFVISPSPLTHDWCNYFRCIFLAK